MSRTWGGVFAPVERLGRGGMGEVWRAVHLPTGTEVAVKELTGRGGGWESAFKREIQALARLDHPGVVAVLDAATDGDPWLAMELCSGGTLATAAPGTWEGLRGVVDVLLDGLALAHARGVIHRDLKPSNVLLGAPTDARPGWKLADFGIARLMAEGRDGRADSGTPAYMAPEQLRGDARAVGPATDLYALGCLVWALVCGQPPFDGPLAEVAHGHLSAPPPRFAPRMAVPLELEGWLRTCLAKRPDHRFGRAAEAGLALAALGPVSGGDAPQAVAVPPTAETADLSGSWRSRLAVATETRVSGGSVASPEATIAPPVPGLRCPLPDRPPPGLPQRVASLRGAGLGLYALRVHRLVGRDEVQATLWREAVTAARDGRTRLVLLEGPSGAGKSALAEWLVEAVHRVGGVGLVARHPEHVATDGPADLVRDGLGAAGLDRDALAARLRDLGRARGLPVATAAAILERLAPAGAGADRVALPQVELATTDARDRALADGLAWAADGRPTVAWFDDLHWGPIAVDWLGRQLDRPGPLVVATVQREAAAARPEIALALDALRGRDGVAVIEVGPLPVERWPALVHDLLELEGPAAVQVEERTQGNPMFARTLVGDWVARGLLEASGTGFRLREGAAVDLPEALAAAWRGRADRLAAAVDPAGRAAWWLAAALGVDVDRDVWEAACARGGGDPGRAPVDRAAREALVRWRPAGFSFAHGMLREAVWAGVPEPERAALHVACAEALAALDHDFGYTERIARHWISAGRVAEALRPMWQGALHRQRRGDVRGGLALLDERDRWLEGAEMAPGDLARAEGLIQRGRSWAAAGATHRSLDLLLEGVEAAGEGWNGWIAAGAVLAANHLATYGRHAETLRMLDVWEGRLATDTDRALAVSARAMVALVERRFDDALAHLASGESLELGLRGRAELQRIAIGVYAFQGLVEPATRAYREMVETCGGVALTELALAAECMGVLHHVRGEWEPALAYYQECTDRYAALGGGSLSTRLNVAEIHAHRGELTRAREGYDVLVAAVSDADHARWAHLHALGLRLAAAAGDAEALAASVAGFEARFAACGIIDTDLEKLASDAAVDAARRGLDPTALLAIAARQRQALG